SRYEEDLGFHRRKRMAGGGSRPALPLHGTEGDRERRDPVYEGARPEGEPAARRGPGPEARARHPEHGAPDPSRILRGGGEAVARDLPQMGGRAGAVGTGD